MKKKAIIISLSGKKLTIEEKKMLSKKNPWGIILFKRNIESLKQIRLLVKDIKRSVNNNNFPILIDEEGGNVCRLSNFLDNKIYSQSFFGKIFEGNKNLGLELYRNYIHSISSVLRSIGVNINTVPVLDIFKPKTHNILRGRCFSKNIDTISILGNECIESYKKNKIGTIIKHIPGHGEAKVDSHKKLPVIKKSYSSLIKDDFAPFKNKKSYFAMTAHILYSDIDSVNVATHSKNLIKNIIRKKIGFKGILISDDISMKALKYDLVTNAKKSLEAGCNLVLHCSGNIDETKRLLDELPFIDYFTAKKTSEFYKFLG
tara:strand:- start:396 stop:1343 length:948 start_codon:yes stop_codon:yes gene_type:complete